MGISFIITSHRFTELKTSLFAKAPTVPDCHVAMFVPPLSQCVALCQWAMVFSTTKPRVEMPFIQSIPQHQTSQLQIECAYVYCAYLGEEKEKQNWKGKCVDR